MVIRKCDIHYLKGDLRITTINMVQTHICLYFRQTKMTILFLILEMRGSMCQVST